jgi:hypothetical protein
MISLLIQNSEREKVLRGFGGAGGKRSMTTDRGGTWIAAKFRITRQKKTQLIENLTRFYQSEKKPKLE